MNNEQLEEANYKCLSVILERQKKLNEKWIKFEQLTDEEKEKWTKEFIMCCFSELIELLNETNHKHWKSTKKQINIDNIKSELSDILHFYLSLCLIWGLDSKQIIEQYIKKNDLNFARQNDAKLGYIQNGIETK